MRGAEIRMGYAAQRNLPFGPGVIVNLLELVKEEINTQESAGLAREYCKLGAASCSALCLFKWAGGVSTGLGWLMGTR
jgi:hypothetical protein